MFPPQFQVSAAVHLLQNQAQEDPFAFSRGRSPQPPSSRSVRYSVDSSSVGQVVRQTSAQLPHGGMDTATILVSSVNTPWRRDSLSALAHSAVSPDQPSLLGSPVPTRMTSTFAPHSVRSPPPIVRDSVRFSAPTFSPTQVLRQTSDGRSISSSSGMPSGFTASVNVPREASVLRSFVADSFVSPLPSYYSSQAGNVKPFVNVPPPLVQQRSRIVSPMLSSRFATPAVASTPRSPIHSIVPDIIPSAHFLSPRPGTSTPMPSPPVVNYPSLGDRTFGPAVRAHGSNPIGGNPAWLSLQSRLSNSTPDLLPPPWSPQVSDLLLLRSGASRDVQARGGTHSPRPQGSPVWKAAPAPVRMLSSTAPASETPLSVGPRVDWNTFEERWYHGDFIEGKLRGWLATIPISGGTDRAWDDAQILSLVQFAQEQHVEHLPAEEIYRLYVQHQVELADMA